MSHGSTTSEQLLDALAPLLVRGFRDALYQRIQHACPVPVRDGTYPLLVTLATGPATAAEVAQRVGVDRTVATRQAAVLQEAGLLVRLPSPHDGRATLLELTDSGHRAAGALREATLAVLDNLSLSGITEADLAATTRTLRALTAMPTVSR